jgi:DNA invertase Pin-like site-specific DNA recombinase
MIQKGPYYRTIPLTAEMRRFSARSKGTVTGAFAEFERSMIRRRFKAGHLPGPLASLRAMAILSCSG